MNRAAGVLLAILVAGSIAVFTLPLGGPPTQAAPSGPSALPGVDADTLAPAVAEGLQREVGRRMEHGHVPRTRHLQPDGRPTYTNRLVHSASPYLQQHAHNPVNWFPWGDEAFALAKQLNRPVFLSVGYATCHWCHVMEEESFEDPEIAAFLNAHFIAIKVDREARPDVDRVYMSAVQAVNRSGGWPMSVWLEPDRKPFFAATYLPARDGDRGSRRGFLSVLQDIATTWRERPDELHATAATLTAAVQENLKPGPDSGVPGPEAFAAVVTWAKDRYDAEHGGTVGRPKFPSDLPVRVLLSAGAKGDAEALSMARNTLDHMSNGGLYDHVGGGFHRYTVDGAWQVPHFEKMLYDNALLARLYGEAFQLTGDLRYARILEETLTFLQRDLGVRDGGFASALDADSLGPTGEREEGRYYTWTPDELAVLGDDAPGFQQAYGVTAAGDLEGRSILHLSETPTLEARSQWTRARLALQLERRKRPAPLRDEKVITAWNGLAIDAFAYSGWLLGRDDWVDEARHTAEVLLGERTDGRLTRLAGAPPEGSAFLEDYAFLIRGLLTLFEVTGEVRWLEEARALEAIAREHHGSPTGAWFQTADDHEALLVREVPSYDQAVPSANTVMLEDELRLAALTGDDGYRAMADRIAGGLDIQRVPGAFPVAVLALDGRHEPLEEVVLVRAPDQRMSDLKAALKRAHPSWRVVIQTTGDDPELARLAPPAAGKIALDGLPTAYVCRGGVCDRPTTDPAVLAELVTRRAR
ncbi:MAG: thioredoxin domain-containing protein [Myxococcota bacterium]